MIHHSISHGVISVLSVLSANLLARHLSQTWPLVNGLIGDLSVWLATLLPLGIDPFDWYRALIALVMGMGWGGAFWVITVRSAMREEQP